MSIQFRKLSEEEAYTKKIDEIKNDKIYVEDKDEFRYLGRVYKPVVRGKWIRISDDLWKCSVCGERCCCEGLYCNGCGADMRGEI